VVSGKLEGRRLGGWPGGVPPPTMGAETAPGQPAGRQRSVGSVPEVLP
jgi:hypothetical protein